MSCIQDPDLPEVDDGLCCTGAAMYGAGGCTCWRSVYDVDQADPMPAARVVRPGGMCGDCAYRPGSPEKAGDPGYRGDADQLEVWAEAATPFHCHDGLRRRVGRRHPAGVELHSPADEYDPPILDGVPYRADGQPGYLCAGWDARRRAIAARVEPP